MNSKTVAITGVSGLIGQVLLPHLERDPAVSRVVGVDLRPSPQNSSKLSFHQLDVRDSGLEDLLAGVDTLVHLAFVLFRSRGQKRAEVDSINVQGTQAVCEAAARQRQAHRQPTAFHKPFRHDSLCRNQRTSARTYRRNEVKQIKVPQRCHPAQSDHAQADENAAACHQQSWAESVYARAYTECQTCHDDRPYGRYQIDFRPVPAELLL